MSQYSFIDLFSGCGGLSLGFEMSGYKSILAIDNWKDALNTYSHNRKNAHVLCADLAELNPKQVKKNYNIKDVDVIIGGPPCQGVSIAGKRIIDDERNKLYKSFVRFVDTFKPKAFVMENVPNILSIGGGVIKDAILTDFNMIGYTVSFQILKASDYGVPQNRKRAVFVGLRNGRTFEFPKSFDSEKISSFDALSDLPEYSLPNGANYEEQVKSNYQKLMRIGSSGIFNHEITIHNQRTKDIIALVPDGGNYKNLPKDLQGTRKVHIAWTRLNSQAPSFTIDTGHRHHFHYKYNRIPTVRESARIQSFPDNFIFLGSKTSQYKQVGNAVPPLLAIEIAKCLERILNEHI